MIDTTTPRMTKRVKNYKPKQNLSRAQVQTLVALLSKELEGFEWEIVHYKYVAESCKGKNKETSDLYFKRTDKARVQRNKLSKIQHILKRGLV